MPGETDGFGIAGFEHFHDVEHPGGAVHGDDRAAKVEGQLGEFPGAVQHPDIAAGDQGILYQHFQQGGFAAALSANGQGVIGEPPCGLVELVKDHVAPCFGRGDVAAEGVKQLLRIEGIPACQREGRHGGSCPFAAPGSLLGGR